MSITRYVYHHTTRSVRALREKRRFVIGIVLLLAVLFFFIHAQKPTPETEVSTEENTRVATTATPEELIAMKKDPIIFTGEVRSENYAELRSETNGEVRRVYVTAGEYVSAGTVLVEFEQATEQAQVAQARTILTQAQSAFQRIQAGTRKEDRLVVETEVARAKSQLETARRQAENAYINALSLAENAVFAHADSFFSSPNTARPSFHINSASTDEKSNIERDRVEIGKIRNKRREHNTSAIGVSQEDIQFARATTETIQSFLTSIAGFVATQTTGMPSRLPRTEQDAILLSARSTIASAQDVLLQAQQQLVNADAGYTTAIAQQERTETGERDEDVAIAQAQVAQAEAGLASAQALLEKTRIRAPISGTITTLNLTQGDFVTAQEIVAVVSGEGDTLLVESFVSAPVLAQLQVGQSVRITGSTVTGTIVSVAPGLDPSTKLARIVTALPTTESIPRGSFVTLVATPTQPTVLDVLPQHIPIPLTAIKVLPSGMTVYTVVNGTVTSLPIPEGPLLGDTMLVNTESIPLDTRILVDARAYAVGDVVTEQ